MSLSYGYPPGQPWPRPSSARAGWPAQRVGELPRPSTGVARWGASSTPGTWRRPASSGPRRTRTRPSSVLRSGAGQRRFPARRRPASPRGPSPLDGDRASARGRRPGRGRRGSGPRDHRPAPCRQIRSSAAGIVRSIERRGGEGAMRSRRHPGGGLARQVDRPSPAEQLEEDHAEAVDVAPLVGQIALTAGLLGAHVGRGPEDRPVACQVRIEVGPPRQTEVGQVGPALVRR